MSDYVYYKQKYSKNDLNQFYYLNDQLNLWVKNRAMRSIPMNEFTWDKIKNALKQQEQTVISDFKRFFQTYTDGTVAPYQCGYFSSKTRFTYVNHDYITILNRMSVGLDHNYRLYISKRKPPPVNGKQDKNIYNVYVRYNISNLQDPEDNLKDFYPIVNFADVAPFMYLESCTSLLHLFFRKLFNLDDSNTIDNITRRCILDNDNIDIACGREKNNIRCACEPCYSKHSNQSRRIGDLLRKSNTVSNDPWCIYPDCASGLAFKNRLLQNRSLCSNISVAGVFLNPGEYSNINISNTQVSASSANANGINLYGDGNCPEGQHFEVDNVKKEIKCVNKDSKDSKDSKDIKDIKDIKDSKDSKDSNKLLGRSHSSGLHWSLWFMMGMVVLTVILFCVYKFGNITVKYNEYLIKGIIIGLLLSIFFLVYYIVTKSTESYSRCSEMVGNNKLCYYDSQCGDKFECLDNECSCGIGYFYDKDGTSCIVYPSDSDSDGDDSDFSKSVLTTLPYLPLSVFSGVYYYSTVINDEIYVFSSHSNFKYDGSKWQELNIFDGQKGFHPYDCDLIVPPLYPEDENKVNLNSSNMCCTYNNKVYVLVVPNTIIYGINSKYPLLIYDTIDNRWEYLNIEHDNIEVVSGAIVIKDNLLYMFGDKKFEIYDLDSKDYINDIDNTYTFGRIACAFLHNETIYVGVVNGEEGEDKGYSIFRYDNNKFNLIIKLKTNFNINKILSGGVMSGYLDGIFYILADAKLYYYNFENKDDSSVDGINIIMPEGTSIFNYGKQQKNDNYFDIPYTFSKGNTTFHKNGFIFIVTGSGEIFRGYMVKKDGKVNEFRINPCYGVASYGQPIQNSIVQI